MLTDDPKDLQGAGNQGQQDNSNANNDDKEQKTFSYEYVKELRNEAKQYRLKAKELEETLTKIQQENEKEKAELLLKVDNLLKEINEIKPKAEKFENRIKEYLINQIPDEELKKQALEKYTDIEQLEFYVNSLKELTKNFSKPSTMDNSNKQTSVETEYINALKSGNILKAIALKNKAIKQ